MGLEFNHVSIKTREEEDVVDQLKQLGGIVLNLLDEQRLVRCLMRHIEEFGETHHRAQRGTDLIAHIAQEGILDRLHILSFGRFESQPLLCCLDFADITTDAKILGNDTIIV